jgi:membrane protein
MYISLKEIINSFIWDKPLESLPLWRAWIVRNLQIIYVVIRDLTQGQLNLEAMSLVYTSLLSIVPLLAVSFSVLKGFGVHNQFEPLLLNFLEPLGEKSVEISQRLIGFVENIEVKVLGGLGLVVLIYTVISLIHKIEMVLNRIWHVEHPRAFLQRFSDYFSVILIGPVLVFSAIGSTASVMESIFVQKLVAIKPVGLVINSTEQLLPYFFIIGAFTFVYLFLPNTRVRFRSAFIGAIVAGVLWQSIGWGFASFIVSSSQYAAIYSGFAILVIFMLWLYLAWLILLIGSSIAFYHQHPEYLSTRQYELQISNRIKERLAFLSMYLISQQHFYGGESWTDERLAKQLVIPRNILIKVLALLEKSGLLIRAGEDLNIYLLARAPETILLKELLDIVRIAGEDRYFNLQQLSSSENRVEQLLEEIDTTLEEVLKGRSLKTLVCEDSSGSIKLLDFPSELVQ